MKIKYITFDFWDTIFKGDDPSSKKREKYRINTLQKYLDKKDFHVKKQKISKGFDKTWKYFNRLWKNKYITPQNNDLLEFLFKTIGFQNYTKTQLKKLSDTLSLAILEYPPQLTENYLKKLIPNLSKNYTLGIVSDTGFTCGKNLRKLLIKYNLYRYFDDFAFSNEIGRSKPHEKMFIKIIKDLKNGPRLIHIGDLLATDVKGAKNISAKSILYKKNNQTYNYNDTKPDYIIKTWENFLSIINKIESQEK